MNIESNNVANSQLNVFDLQSLRRFTSSSESTGDSLKQAAKQFEGIFIRQLLTSMRKVNDLFKEDSLFDSSTSDFYQEMWDDQIATSLGDSNNPSSISSLMVQQFEPKQNNTISRQFSTVKYIDTQINNAAVIKPKLIINNSSEINPSEVDKANAIEKSEPFTFETKQQFIDVLYPKAKLAAEKIGGSAKALLAQIALETGWGKYIIQKDQSSSSNNLFNIKNKADWTGDVAYKKTVEFDGQKFNLETAGFKIYQSFNESFEDFVNFLHSKERYQGVIEKAADPKQYFNQLQQSGYATDPEYATKIEKIYNSEFLNKVSD
jgi:flagellar protein FlgJ